MLATLCFYVITSGAIKCIDVEPHVAIMGHMNRITREDPTHTMAKNAGLRDPFVMDESDPRWNTYAPEKFRHK